MKTKTFLDLMELKTPAKVQAAKSGVSLAEYVRRALRTALARDASIERRRAERDAKK